MADDLVTVAASRIFNRSGKTQIVKKVCMKTILDEVFDDTDPIPYTSIEKLEEKKKKAQKKGNIFYIIILYHIIYNLSLSNHNYNCYYDR